MRWHESYEKYPSHLDSIDDIVSTQCDEYERFKPYKAKKDKVIGSVPLIMREDNDEKWNFYDIQGESLYSPPPDPNWITVDHGLDEDNIWSFPHSAYNQEIITNPYNDANAQANYRSHAPTWGQKLSQPHFYKPEKMEKFHRHWQHRIGLEALKMKHVAQYGAFPTEE